MSWIREQFIVDGHTRATNTAIAAAANHAQRAKEWQGYAEELEDEIKHLKKEQAKAAAAAARAEKEALKYEKAFEYSSEQFRKSTADGFKKDSIIEQKDAEIVKQNRENLITVNYLNRIHVTSKLDHAILGSENLIRGILDEMKHKSVPGQHGIRAES